MEEALGAGTRHAYGHKDCCAEPSHVGTWSLRKDFRVQQGGGTLNLHTMLAVAICNIHAAVSFSDITTQTYMCEDDAFYSVDFFDASTTLISSVVSHSWSHMLAAPWSSPADDGAYVPSHFVGDALSNGYNAPFTVWQPMEYTVAVPTDAVYVEVSVVATDGNDQVRSVGHLEANSAVLLSKLDVGYDRGGSHQPPSRHHRSRVRAAPSALTSSALTSGLSSW